MGVTSAIGAGLSVVGGLSQSSQQKQTANAQKKAISNQAEIDQLNSQLQLQSLQNSRATDRLNDEIRAASDNMSYLSTQAQINATETQQATDLARAESSYRVEGMDAATDSRTEQTQALLRGQDERSATANALVQAIGASSEDQQLVLSKLQEMPEQQRANTIASLLDAAASSGGTNVALKMLADLSGTGTTALASAARAEESQATKAQLARDSASASTALSLSTEASATTSAKRKQLDRENQVAQGLVDTEATRKVGESSFASQRTSVEGAKESNDRAAEVERLNREAQYSSNEEVITRGAELSASTAKAQTDAVKSPGFFDYAGVAANAASGFLNSK
jgi:hypothetical protein